MEPGSKNCVANGTELGKSGEINHDESRLRCRQAAARLAKYHRAILAIRDAIELIATGRVKTIEAAAQRVGWERSRLSKWLSRPECIAAAKERAAKAVAVGALRSGARLGELVESESAKVAREATKFSPRAAGIGPATGAPVNVSFGVKLKTGWIINVAPEDEAERQMIERQTKVIDAKAS